MENQYGKIANLFKSMSDPNRLMIINMLADGELCACKILEELHITQPTLSHHMKILCESGLVTSRRDGIWMRYSLDRSGLGSIKGMIDRIWESQELIQK